MNRSYKKILISTVILLLGLMIPSTAQNPRKIEVRASISADKIGMDDVLIYTVIFQGITNPSKPHVGGLVGFKVAQSSRNTEFRFVNGISSYITNFVYYLTPLQTGKFTLPVLTYSHQGRDFTARSFLVEVVKGSVAPHAPRQRNRMPSVFDNNDFFSTSPFRRQQKQVIDIRMMPDISSRKVVKGEQVVYKVLLYTRNRVRSVNMISNQSLPGFWQEWFPVSDSIDAVTRNVQGKTYQVYEVRKVALFPTKSGTITIPPLKFQLGLGADSFSFFSNDRRIIRSTPQFKLEVSPSPPGAEGLPVGHFKMSLMASKKKVDVNDILTLKMRISGTGNIKILMPPEIENSEYFKVYPSKVSRDVSFSGNKVSGYVEAEIPVAFKKKGLITFAPLNFKYYDPVNRQVVTLKTQALAVNVIGSKEIQVNASTIPNTEIIKQGEDIDFLKKGTLHNQDKNIYNAGYFIWILLLPFLLNLLYILKVHLFDPYVTGSNLLKKRKLLNGTLRDLGKVRDAGGISPVLEKYLKEKAGLGLSAINNQSIDSLLGMYRVSDKDIKTFIRIKSQSDSSRFSPDKTSNGVSAQQQLKKDLKVLTDIIKRIDSKIK